MIRPYQIILSVLTFALLLSSCQDNFLSGVVKAPDAYIERDVRGHEQIYSIQAILRLAQKREGVSPEGMPRELYSAYGMSRKQTPYPVFQQIDISKDDDGSMVITSDRKAFDVLKGGDFYYALELRYYDLNGQLINHQFASYDDKKDLSSNVEAGYTLPVHQHFFAINNYSLTGLQHTYPMSLDSIYYDAYLFGSRMVPSDMISPSNVYAPAAGHSPNSIHYDPVLANLAIKNSNTKDADKEYSDDKGQKWRLYRTININDLNRKVQEIFTYTYRDTDPVDQELGSEVERQIDDLGRIRNGKPVMLLKQSRSLELGGNPDKLGFKGLLRFHKSNIAFQMRVCIAHIQTPGHNTATGKYKGDYDTYDHYDLQPSWSTFDIDYPLGFRVIADLDGDRATCIKDIQKYYPEATEGKLQEMLWTGAKYFKSGLIPIITF